MFSPSRILSTVALAAALSLAAGCSTLPSNTQPQALASYVRDEPHEPIAGPLPDQEPDLLLRDFYAASAIPTSDYSAARAFLSPEMAQSWTPAGRLLLVDAVDIVTQPDSATESSRTFDVRGTVIGSLATGGSYSPENGRYEAQIELSKVDGQWRISNLPNVVVIERTELRNQYQPHSLYFYNQAGTALVADRRWIYSGQDSLDTALITLLLEGPAESIAPATSTVAAPGVQFVGVTEGRYEFIGATEMSPEERSAFAAELVWMLASAGIPGPYQFIADGSALVEGLDSLTTDDFADSNPRTAVNTVSSLFTVTDGALWRVTANEGAPVAGALGSASRVQSADVTPGEDVAAVLVDAAFPPGVPAPAGAEQQVELVVGSVAGEVNTAVVASTISRPTFEPGDRAVWAVLDGEDVVRIVRTSTGELTVTEVNSTAIDNIPGEISVLRLSRTGARVALIIDGRIYVGITARSNTGEYRIVNLYEIATEIAGTALSLDWQPDGSLVVGTSATETPVWRVEYDGSAVSTMASGNITAPVVAIASSPSTVYITDSRAMLQIPASDSSSVFWREVPGMQGIRSAPIVAR